MHFLFLCLFVFQCIAIKSLLPPLKSTPPAICKRTRKSRTNLCRPPYSGIQEIEGTCSGSYVCLRSLSRTFGFCFFSFVINQIMCLFLTRQSVPTSGGPWFVSIQWRLAGSHTDFQICSFPTTGSTELQVWNNNDFKMQLLMCIFWFVVRCHPPNDS